VDERRVHVEHEQAEVGHAQRRGDAANDEAGGDFDGGDGVHVTGSSLGVPSDLSTSRMSCARSFGSGVSRSMRSLSLPASLMWRFFCTSSMMRIASTGGLGRKLMTISFGAASIFVTP